MVDREARNKTAVLLRHYAASRITNRELDENLPHSEADHTASRIDDVLEVSFECLYGKPFRANSKGPASRRDRRTLARIAMYLYTDLEHPKRKDLPVIMQILLGLLILLAIPLLVAVGLVQAACQGIIALFTKIRGVEDAETSDDFWPFLSFDEYEEALKHPKLLCGKSRSD
jgi:hypothetical protein